MAELVKQWDDGGSLTATYEGSGDGSAVFSSDEYEGIDRTMPVFFKGGGLSVERLVRQEGIRERFVTADGKVFCILDGGRFGVLKSGFEPEEPPTMETYTRLTYIECTGAQYINTGYVVQEDDVIECYYDVTELSKADKFLFGSFDSNAVWLSIYNYTAYSRFGSGTTTTTNYAYRNHYVKMQKEAVQFDTETSELTYEAMPSTPLFVFARRNTSGNAGAFFVGRCMMFKISNADNVVIELRPAKRDSDGKVGMLDLVSGQFYASEGEADFLGGNEIRITEGYELIDSVSCNKDKRFDTGFYGNSETYIEVMFQRTLTSSAAYLFGCTQGDRLTGYLSSSSGSWRYGSGNPTFATATMKIYKGVVTPGKTSVDDTSKTFSFTEFTTSYTLPVAGYKASSDTITKHFVGYLYYFRMWYGDALLLDWYPCKRLSDNEQGFWDCVSQTFVESI